MILTFCVGTVQEGEVMVGCVVSTFLFCALGILLAVDGRLQFCRFILRCLEGKFYTCFQKVLNLYLLEVPVKHVTVVVL